MKLINESGRTLYVAGEDVRRLVTVANKVICSDIHCQRVVYITELHNQSFRVLNTLEMSQVEFSNLNLTA